MPKRGASNFDSEGKLQWKGEGASDIWGEMKTVTVDESECLPRKISIVNTLRKPGHRALAVGALIPRERGSPPSPPVPCQMALVEVGL